MTEAGITDDIVSTFLNPRQNAGDPAGRGATDLTQHEIKALKTRYNLADAHTHQRQSPEQEKIVARLTELWHESEDHTQAYFEDRLRSAFFRLHRQPTALRMDRALLSYSASVSTMVAAMYLRRHGMSVALVEPCFDNLTDLLRNMQVPLEALPEESLADPARAYDRLAEECTADAVYLVDPNNPTGFTLASGGMEGLREVVRFCADHGRLLVLDFCFASFALAAEGTRADVYALLEESGIDYLAIEDTGKTWPLQDAKCALLTAGGSLQREIYDLHTSVLLNVSPFVLNVVARYVEDSIEDGMGSVRRIVRENAATARNALHGPVLEYQEPMVETSVAWFRIRPGHLTASRLQEELLADEVYVLPGTYFYWSAPERGERFVRVALAREPEMFRLAMDRMRKVLMRHER
ncbi:aminotransferase class I/II-fold pyridoxal phosphate-dependent enzyme [Nocardiopsis sp. RSe5-2]|uniref:Aminotransferase class I/II-fold pyridoxal phosphate-dependent enzyme n=1 Tax=Nocardiopsis endophytica TaxID=3018445 RepID=A0ABT4TYX9_9ACTN|nr:aminotransferase class I/II-fold pyridoxal phosphate-dependent enzyme [Nocardiopsis endophytica]MDA2809435.1 aminotransferase class I/II-fold pyridoxal phosphate-dependent enzyme [Nocardiopsis endophytica]